MSTTDRQHSTLLRQRRNRIVSGFYRSNPSIRVPDGSADIRLQIALGSQTIRRQNAGSGVTIISPCGCDTPASGQFLRSKNNITDGGFPIGDEPEKDMTNDLYTDEFDPMDYYPSFFPGMAEISDANIVAGDKPEEDRLQASYWDDLGDDVFDNWGYFYLYDVASGKYYFPLINPQNLDDGIFTTQTFNVFGRTFTITHGWAVQGIFKFDISVADALPFRFGAYGEMGSDGDELTEDLTHPYTFGDTPLTLYYHHHEEDGDTYEKLYSYFVPKVVAENNSQTYNAYYDSDDMSMISKEVTSGLIVYFSKTNDVKEWVANDLEFGSP